jgi:hypothetical protein
VDEPHSGAGTGGSPSAWKRGVDEHGLSRLFFTPLMGGHGDCVDHHVITSGLKQALNFLSRAHLPIARKMLGATT